MSKEEQEILIGKGLNDLPFGASLDEVKQVLGEPEETDEMDLKGEKSIAWHYWEIGLSLNFDEHQGFNLSSIDVASPEVLLFGKALIGWCREDVKRFLDGKGIGESVDELQRGMIYPDANLSLWFNGGDLEEIQWGVILDSGDSA